MYFWDTKKVRMALDWFRVVVMVCGRWATRPIEASAPWVSFLEGTDHLRVDQRFFFGRTFWPSIILPYNHQAAEWHGTQHAASVLLLHPGQYSSGDQQPNSNTTHPSEYQDQVLASPLGLNPHRDALFAAHDQAHRR